MQVVTYDASPAAGAAEHCADNVRRAFGAIFELGETSEGRRQLADAFQLCDTLDSADLEALAFWLQVW